MTKPRLSHYALLLMQGAIWGSSFQAIKLALQDFGPITVAAGRIGLAAVLMTLYAYSRGHRLPTDWLTWRQLAFVGLFNCALPFFLIPWGEQSLDSSRAAIFMATGPLITLLLARLTQSDEQLNRFKLTGFIMGFTGVLTIIGLGTFRQGLGELLPQLAIIGAATSYAISGLLAKRIPHLSSSVFTAMVLSTAALMTLPFSLILEQPWQALQQTDQLTSVWALLYLGLIPTGLAFLIRFHLIRSVGFTFVAQVGYLVPVFGVLFGVWLLNEPLTATIVIGLCLILSGIGVSRMTPRT